MKDIRPSIERGWYPQNRSELTSKLDSFLQNANVDKPIGELSAVIVPHAGHIYSGPVAAYAFNCLRGLNFDTVIVVSPYHYQHSGSIVTTSHQAYKTPLGLVEVDHTLTEELNLKLKERLGEGLDYIANDPEHAIEVELPFLQHTLGHFRLLPLMIVNQRSKIAEELGHSIAEIVIGRKTLLVASSDLSHYYSQKTANRLDKEILRRIELFDPRGVIEAEKEGIGFACGRAAIASVLWACIDLGAKNLKVLKYATSGDITGEYDEVVGYGAAIISKSQ